MHFERHFAFQNAKKYIFFPENLKKIYGSPVKSKFRWGRVTLKMGIFLFGPNNNMVIHTPTLRPGVSLNYQFSESRAVTLLF